MSVILIIVFDCEIDWCLSIFSGFVTVAVSLWFESIFGLARADRSYVLILLHRMQKWRPNIFKPQVRSDQPLSRFVIFTLVICSCILSGSGLFLANECEKGADGRWRRAYSFVTTHARSELPRAGGPTAKCRLRGHVRAAAVALSARASSDGGGRESARARWALVGHIMATCGPSASTSVPALPNAFASMPFPCPAFQPFALPDPTTAAATAQEPAPTNTERVPAAAGLAGLESAMRAHHELLAGLTTATMESNAAADHDRESKTSGSDASNPMPCSPSCSTPATELALPPSCASAWANEKRKQLIASVQAVCQAFKADSISTISLLPVCFFRFF